MTPTPLHWEVFIRRRPSSTQGIPPGSLWGGAHAQKFKQAAQVESKCIKCGYCAVIGEERPLKCHYGRLPA